MNRSLSVADTIVMTALRNSVDKKPRIKNWGTKMQKLGGRP